MTKSRLTRYKPNLYVMLRLLPLLLFIAACGSDVPDEEGREKAFFDLAAYFDAQIDSLQRAQPTVQKTVILNGKEETKELTDLDFAADLRMFRESDINKPDWVDKYTTERTDEGRMVMTVYTAVDTSLQTRELAISTVAEVPEQITIRRKTGTVLSDGNHLLEYRPDYGYRMRTLQTNRFGKDLDAMIAVEWN